MVKKLAIAVVGLIVILCAVIATRPAEFTVERTLVMNAPPEVAFAQVNDFHKWEAWSPWAKLDPSMKTAYSGSESGKGAVYTWAGNDDVGEGRMTINDSTEPKVVDIKLEFLKPMEQTNKTTFTFNPSDKGTTVVWSMKGENGFVGKAFSLVMNIDEMVGKDFEKGLSQMKTAAEAEAKALAEKKAAEEAAAQAAAAQPPVEGEVPPATK